MAAWSLLGSSFLYLFGRVFWRVGDEGSIVYGAQRVLEGQVPGRDFFEAMGPGSFYWLAAFLRMFGSSFAVVHTQLVITGVLIALLVLWLTRQVYNGPFRTLPALVVLVFGVPFWPSVSHHHDSNLFALLSLASFFVFRSRRKPGWLVLSGILAAATTAILQQKGVLLMGALVIACAIEGWRSGRAAKLVVQTTAALCAGYLLAGGAAVAYFAAQGALDDLIYANFIWPATQYHTVNRVPYGYSLEQAYWSWLEEVARSLPHHLTWVAEVVLFIPLAAVYLLPFFVVAVAVWCYLDRRVRGAAFGHRMLPLWLAGSAVALSEMHRPDYTHLTFAAPALVILALRAWTLASRKRRTMRQSAALVLGLCTVALGLVFAGAALTASTPIQTRRGPLRSLSDDAALEYLHREVDKGEPVFVYPYLPMYYFLADVKNPTRYSILMYNINTPEQFAEVVSDLERQQVRIVLWDTVAAGDNLSRWFPGYVHPPHRDLVVENYLAANYELKASLNGFRVLLRKGTPATATGRDLSSPPRGVRASADGPRFLITRP